MIHQPVRSSNGSKSRAKDMMIQAEEIDKSRSRLNEVLAECTGRPLAAIEALMDNDHYCSATEAVELGLADHVASRGRFVQQPSRKDSFVQPPTPAAEPAAIEAANQRLAAEAAAYRAAKAQSEE